MGNKKTPSLNFKKYGVPLYSACCVPVRFTDRDRDRSSDNGEASNSTKYYVVLAGGGGEGRSGIPNAVLISSFYSDANSLSDLPVFKLDTRSDLPYRTAVHPNGDGVLCSFPNSCRWYEMGEKEEICKLILKESDKLQPLLEDVGQQLSLVFNNEGSALAAGGEDGNLRVFKWPSMVIILDEASAHKSVKDLDFSPDGKCLVSLGNSGPAKVWDLASKTTTASLPKENDEVFCFCRFSMSNDTNQVLYIAAATGKGGSIVTWDTETWKRIGSKTVVRDTISAFSVSPNGKLLACGTTQGDVFILNSASKQVQTVVRKAHLGFVTALSFSHDSRALASVSWDSSARVTLIEERKEAEFTALTLSEAPKSSRLLEIVVKNGSGLPNVHLTHRLKAYPVVSIGDKDGNIFYDSEKQKPVDLTGGPDPFWGAYDVFCVDEALRKKLYLYVRVQSKSKRPCVDSIFVGEASIAYETLLNDFGNAVDMKSVILRLKNKKGEQHGTVTLNYKIGRIHDSHPANDSPRLQLADDSPLPQPANGRHNSNSHKRVTTFVAGLASGVITTVIDYFLNDT